MAEALSDVANIAKVSIEGIDVIVKLSGASLKSLAKVFEFFKSMLDFEKANGRTSMFKLLKKGGDLQVMSLKKDDLKKLKKQLKKYGVLYSEIPDYKKDGTVDLIFHTESLPRVNRIFEKFVKDKESASIKSFDEFVKESDGNNLDLLQKELEKEKRKAENSLDLSESERKNWDSMLDKVAMYAADKKEVTPDALANDLHIDTQKAKEHLVSLEQFGIVEKKKENESYVSLVSTQECKNKLSILRGFAERTSELERAKMERMKPVFIAESLIKEANDKNITTRIPGTYGENERRVAFEKEDVFPRKEDKSFRIYIDETKDYDILDRGGKKIDTVKGSKLLENYSQMNQKMQEILRLEKKKKSKEAPKLTKEENMLDTQVRKVR